jgi:hypothetical protein
LAFSGNKRFKNLDCFAPLAMTGGLPLLHFVRNDGRVAIASLTGRSPRSDDPPVIANEVKQSRISALTGLLRRYTPRKDAARIFYSAPEVFIAQINNYSIIPRIFAEVLHKYTE